MSRSNGDEVGRLIEQLHIALVDLRTQRAEHGHSLKTVSRDHVAGFEGELLGLGINGGSKVFLIGARSSGHRRLQPLLRPIFHTLKKRLAAGENIAGKKSKLL